MKSIAEKLEIIKERVFCEEMPQLDSRHCKEILTFLRENINTLPEDARLRIYGTNPHDAQFSAVYNRRGELVFAPSLEDEEVLELPQVSFTIKEIRG